MANCMDIARLSIMDSDVGLVKICRPGEAWGIAPYPKGPVFA